MWVLRHKTLSWGGGIECMDGNSHPFKAQAASQLPHLAWCWPHPFPCCPWTPPWSHPINTTHICNTWISKRQHCHIRTILGLTELIFWHYIHKASDHCALVEPKETLLPLTRKGRECSLEWLRGYWLTFRKNCKKFASKTCKLLQHLMFFTLE